jgi:IclR family KDG regulon transcriptional repressor
VDRLGQRSKSSAKAADRNVAAPRRQATPAELPLKVLLAVAESPRLSVRELAAKVGWPSTSIHRALGSLESLGFLVHDADLRSYRLGAKVLTLASTFLAQHDLVEIGRPVVRGLRDALDETVALQIRVGVRRAPIVIEECSHELKHVLAVGASYPLFAGSAGKVLVAFSDDPELVNAVIKDAVAHSDERNLPFDPEAFRRELKRIRGDGFAMSKDERVLGSRGIAAPVLGGDGELEAALTVHGPTVRMTTRVTQRAIPLLLDASRRLSEVMPTRRRGLPREVRRAASC